MELKVKKSYSFATDASPVQLDLASDVNFYAISGTKTLSASYQVTVTGTPKDGMQVWVDYDGTALTLSGNHVTVMGQLLTDDQAVKKLVIVSTYDVSAWKTRILVDASQGKIVNIGDLGDDTYDNTTIELDSTHGLQLKDDGITNAKVKTSAAIALSKLAALTASEMVISNASGVIVSAPVATYPSLTELSYAKGLISNVQTQINTKITAGGGAIVNADVNAAAAIAYSKLALTNSLLNADVNAAAAIAYSKLNLTGSILNADVNASAAIALSKLAALTASRIVITDGSGVMTVADTATYPTLTELSYVKGLTSAVQTQITNLDTKIETYSTIIADTTYTSATLKKNITLDTTTGAVQATLPSTATLTLGTVVHFNQYGANNGTFAANALDDIVDKTGASGNPTYPAVSIGSGGAITIQYKSANTWNVILEV
jgi:hypothetical protein